MGESIGQCQHAEPTARIGDRARAIDLASCLIRFGVMPKSPDSTTEPKTDIAESIAYGIFCQSQQCQAFSCSLTRWSKPDVNHMMLEILTFTMTP